MKIKLYVILLSIIACSCYTANTEFRISRVKTESDFNMFGFKTGVVYKTKEYIVEETNKKAESQLWTDEKRNMFLSYIPTGGQLSFSFIGKYESYGNAGSYSYIITDQDKKEIKRGSFSDNGTDYTVLNTGDVIYQSRRVVELDTKLPDIFFVYIINEVYSKKHVYKFEFLKK